AQLAGGQGGRGGGDQRGRRGDCKRDRRRNRHSGRGDAAAGGAAAAAGDFAPHAWAKAAGRIGRGVVHRGAEWRISAPVLRTADCIFCSSALPVMNSDDDWIDDMDNNTPDTPRMIPMSGEKVGLALMQTSDVPIITRWNQDLEFTARIGTPGEAHTLE